MVQGGEVMRSYLDIIIDVKDGKKVDYEELRLALLMASDMLFFSDQAVKKFIKKNPNLIISKLETESLESRFKARKNPIEQWWSGNIPKIKE